MSRPLVVLLALLLLPGCVSTSSAAADDTAILESIIADIAAGWENGDPAPFEQHYLDFDGARYVESGGQNVGLRDLIDHHVVPEKDVLESLSLTFENVEVHLEAGFAWALADVHVVAVIREDGSKVDKRGHETFLFRCVGGTWKVVHTHSSTRAR